MKNNIDIVVSQYISLWLKIPVNDTLNIVTQSKRKFGLCLILPSTRHTQCQVTFRNKLRKSSNHNIREFHESTRNINIQYDQFNSTREVKRYQQLLAELSNKYKVYYVNLSLGAIGTIGKDIINDCNGKL